MDIEGRIDLAQKEKPVPYFFSLDFPVRHLIGNYIKKNPYGKAYDLFTSLDVFFKLNNIPSSGLDCFVQLVDGKVIELYGKKKYTITPQAESIINNTYFKDAEEVFDSVFKILYKHKKISLSAVDARIPYCPITCSKLLFRYDESK